MFSESDVTVADDTPHSAADPDFDMIRGYSKYYFPTDEERGIRTEIKLLVKYGKGEIDVGKSADNLFLVGASGSGKTRLLHEVKHELSKLYPGEHSIIIVKVPANATIKGLNIYINRALGLDPYLAADGTEQSQTLAMLERIKDLGVKLLILDEMQHLFDEKLRVATKVATHIKQLLNHCICPVVVAGTAPILGIFNSEEEMRRRSIALHWLEAEDWDVAQGQLNYMAFVRAMTRQLPRFENLDMFKTVDTCMRLYAATGGLRGKTADLIRFAAIRAIESGDKELTIAHLRNAFEKVRRKLTKKQREDGMREEPNPFDEGVVVVPKKAENVLPSKPLRGMSRGKKLKQSRVLDP